MYSQPRNGSATYTAAAASAKRSPASRAAMRKVGPTATGASTSATTVESGAVGPVARADHADDDHLGARRATRGSGGDA